VADVAGDLATRRRDHSCGTAPDSHRTSLLRLQGEPHRFDAMHCRAGAGPLRREQTSDDGQRTTDNGQRTFMPRPGVGMMRAARCLMPDA